MPILTRFHSTLFSSQFAFKSGKIAAFIKAAANKPSEYLTDVEDEIAELRKEISAGHPHITIPVEKADQTVDTNYDPLESIRAKIRDEERARLIAEMGQTPTIGASSTANVPTLGGIKSSTDVNALTQQPQTAPVITQVPPAPENTVVVTDSDPTPQDKPTEDTTQVSLTMTDKLAALKSTPKAS